LKISKSPEKSNGIQRKMNNNKDPKETVRILSKTERKKDENSIFENF
jgi:hypothetical protein